MDFVKFYIIQLVKSAASRIRLIEKEKEKLLSSIVSKIENSQNLFPDLKMMERVVELEETASKLISIYKRLNKSHIDLEKISYQFVTDRDAIQSILRRFLQGNIKNGIIRKQRPKIVFDDTTFTIYELKEPNEVEHKDYEDNPPQQPKIDLTEFLKVETQEIISLEKGDKDYEEKNDIIGADNEKFELLNGLDHYHKTNNLEIENGVVRKTLSRPEKSKTIEKPHEDLVLPLNFEWENQKNLQNTNELIDTGANSENFPSPPEETDFTRDKIDSSKKDSDDRLEKQDSLITYVDRDSEESDLNKFGYASNKDLDGQEKEEQVAPEELAKIDDETNTENQKSDLSEDLIKSPQKESDQLYLEFEKLLFNNILEVDEFLTKVIHQSIDTDEMLKIVNKAYKCFQLAQELNFDLISELIKVYWLSLTAIRDNKLTSDKTNSDLIRSTMIILVSLLKHKDIDLEPFMNKHNKLKEKLKSLDYEV